MAKFAMHHAAKKGSLKRVKHLIERGVYVDSRDDEDRTPLHFAAEHGQYKVAQLLISKQSNVDLKERHGNTPVLLAAKKGKKNVVDLLLMLGAQVNCKCTESDWTLLHHASYNGWGDVVQLIVKGGADVNAATLYGETPLMFAAEIGYEDVAAVLLRAGADIHQRDEYEHTALYLASSFGNPKVVQILLEEEGLDLNSQDSVGDTPLIAACLWERSEVVEQLLTAGADTNIRNCWKETALSVDIDPPPPPLEFSRSIRLFVEHGFFFEDFDYAKIFKNPVIKDNVLKDVDFCTQSILNRFHQKSLPTLFNDPNIAKKLPGIKKFNLKTQQMHEIENYVKWDIQTNTFCDIVKARPIVLSVLCVESLLGTRQLISDEDNENLSPAPVEPIDFSHKEVQINGTNNVPTVPNVESPNSADEIRSQGSDVSKNLEVPKDEGEDDVIELRRIPTPGPFQWFETRSRAHSRKVDGERVISLSAANELNARIITSILFAQALASGKVKIQKKDCERPGDITFEDNNEEKSSKKEKNDPAIFRDNQSLPISLPSHQPGGGFMDPSQNLSSNISDAPIDMTSEQIPSSSYLQPTQGFQCFSSQDSDAISMICSGQFSHEENERAWSPNRNSQIKKMESDENIDDIVIAETIQSLDDKASKRKRAFSSPSPPNKKAREELFPELESPPYSPIPSYDESSNDGEGQMKWITYGCY